MKAVVIPASHAHLHGNRDVPASFNAWIVVADHVLPRKGLELRRYDRDTPKKEEGDVDSVNEFVASDLWRHGGIEPREAPCIVPESEWLVPDEELRSNVGHRSYTDYQQTTQWAGGCDIPTKVLTHLTNQLCSDALIVVHNLTPFDGCLERAVIALRAAGKHIICVSTTTVTTNFTYSQNNVKNSLVTARPTKHASGHVVPYPRCPVVTPVVLLASVPYALGVEDWRRALGRARRLSR